MRVLAAEDSEVRFEGTLSKTELVQRWADTKRGHPETGYESWAGGARVWRRRRILRETSRLNWDKLGQDSVFGWLEVIEKVVELTGIEPVASSLRTRRSPS